MAKEIDPKDSAKKSPEKKKITAPKAVASKKPTLPSKKTAASPAKKAPATAKKPVATKASAAATPKKVASSKKPSTTKAVAKPEAKIATKQSATKSVKPSEKKRVPTLKILPTPVETVEEINATSEPTPVEEKAKIHADVAETHETKCGEAKVGSTPVTDAAKKAAERLGIDSDEVDKAAEKFRLQAAAAQAKIVDALKLVSSDLAVGARKIYEMTESAAKNLGVDSTTLNEAIGKGMDEACDKAIDAAVTASAEFKRGLAGFRLKLEEMRAAAMDKKRTESVEDTSEKSGKETEENDYNSSSDES